MDEIAALAVIEYGIAADDFWRLTPRQFYYLGKRHAARDKRTLDMFRFLATASARAQGHDVNYMEDPEDNPAQESENNWDRFEAWLKAKATTPNGTTDKNSDGRPQGVAGANETSRGIAGPGSAQVGAVGCADADQGKGAV